VSADHIKLLIRIGLCLSALFAALGCALLNSPGGGNSLLPIRSLTLTIDKSQREELFDQLQKFADEHDFRLVLTKYEKTGHFLVELSGDDILITTSDVPPDPALVYISFYGKYPEAQVDEEVINTLVSDLKDFIYEIPNVTITEEE
jgi:hypothetical protein